MPRNAQQKQRVAVISFGRFNPPTTGHAKLVNTIKNVAQKVGAEVAMIFPSQSHDAKRNPLPFQTKVDFMRQMFRNTGVQISGNEKVRTPIDALALLSDAGFTDVYVVVGSDRVAEFQKFGRYVTTKRRKATDIVLRKYEVVPVPGERDPDADDVTGMSASKMRAAAASGDFKTFRQGVPGPEALAQRLYATLRYHMGIKESAFIVFGTSPAAAKALREALRPLKCEMYDMTGRPATQIIREFARLRASGKNVRVYARSQMNMSESQIREQATLGTLMGKLGRGIVVVNSLTEAAAIRDVRRHAKRLMEATGDVIRPKQPSEVERLKLSQKQQMLALKQRHSNELLQAQQRDLQRKAREQQQKLSSGQK